MPLNNLSFFSKPFPTYREHNKQTLICLIAAITVFLMLYILEPFNINLLEAQQKLSYALLYSSITLIICLFLTVITPWLFPHFYHESEWTVLKEFLYVLFILVIISGVNLISHNILDKTPLTIKTFLVSISYTLPLAAFPVSFSILIKQKFLNEKYRKEALLWNRMLEEYQTKSFTYKEIFPTNSSLDEKILNKETIITKEDKIVTLTGTGIGEVLEINVQDLLLISSSENYITIHYIVGQSTRTQLFRNTLKDTEEKTKHIKSIVRCHRSYIVNLNNVERIIGDSQGLKLFIQDIEEPIYVGKSYLTQVKKLLQDIQPLV